MIVGISSTDTITTYVCEVDFHIWRKVFHTTYTDCNYKEEFSFPLGTPDFFHNNNKTNPHARNKIFLKVSLSINWPFLVPLLRILTQ